MHSYGQAEVARLQTLRKDVDRILAKAGAEAVPADNKCVPPPAPVSGEEQTVPRCPLCKDREERTACPTEEPACPPLKRRGLDINRVCWEDNTIAAAPCSPPHRPRSADLLLGRQVYVAVSDVLQQAMAAEKLKRERRDSCDAVITQGMDLPPAGPQLSPSTTGAGSCVGPSQ